MLGSGCRRDVRVLEIDGPRAASRYRSVYFDTPDLDSYLAAARRRRRRFKIRIRSYLDSGRHFLEVKTRGRAGHHGQAPRRRTPVPSRNWARAEPGSYAAAVLAGGRDPRRPAPAGRRR